MAIAAALVLVADVAVVATHEEPGGPCGSGAPLRAGALLECVEPNVAYVETPFGSGSAVLVDDGHLITNLHVIDPFDAVDVTFADGERFTDVPVVGVDANVDIAVLGPIEREGTTVFADADTVSALRQGDPLFLVGYPSETPEDPDVTISQGILSRTRELDRYDATFLQTDAAIGAGQSGGALVDALGHVVGISGLGLDDAYALALAAPDVVAAGRAAAGGDGSPRVTFADTTSSGTFAASFDRQQLLVVPPPAQEQQVRIDFTGGQPLVIASRLDETPIYASRAIFDLLDAETLGFTDADYERLRAVSGTDPAAADFLLPPDEAAFVVVGSLSDATTQLSWSSSTPIVQYADNDDDQPIDDEPVEGVIDYFEFADTYAITLDEGETIDIHVGGAVGDLAYSIYPVGGDPADAEFVDDSDEGLAGLDAHDTFTAPAAGDYIIEVVTYDYVTTGYVLDVQRPD